MSMSEEKPPERTTFSDNDLARDDPNLCEHGWSRMRPQPCPECEDDAPAEMTETYPEAIRRNMIVGTIGETIMDGYEQHPPFPTMPAEVAWRVADEIMLRLEKLGVVRV